MLTSFYSTWLNDYSSLEIQLVSDWWVCFCWVNMLYKGIMNKPNECLGKPPHIIFLFLVFTAKSLFLKRIFPFDFMLLLNKMKRTTFYSKTLFVCVTAKAGMLFVLNFSLVNNCLSEYQHYCSWIAMQEASPNSWTMYMRPASGVCNYIPFCHFVP